MAVSENDVRHVAALARLGVNDARLPDLVRELNGILDHMEVLEGVETGRGPGDAGDAGSGTPMRSDGEVDPIPLMVPREEFAPSTQDGFFLVPRLATHEDQGERTS